MKSALKGRRFCDATDIIKNATDELKRLSQNDLQECFRVPLLWLAEMCIFAQEDCFEEIVA